MNREKLFIKVWCAILFLLPATIWGQTRTITGRVIAADDGLPAIYATVVVKNHATIGQSTDADGKFTIPNVPESATHIQISYIGYQTAEVSIVGLNNVNVVLQPDAVFLDQVVVTALGIQRQAKELGYATAKVTNEDLTSTQNPDAAAALIGKVSGLQINVVGGALDADIRINLRGSRSFKGDNQPMLVLDGAPTDMSVFSSLNPNDIDNISVLKGGSAAALYGSSAANGVIYVTTRKGTRGRPRVTFQSTTTFSNIAYWPEFQTRFGAGADHTVTGLPNYEVLENQQYGPEFGPGLTIPIPVMVLKDPSNNLTEYVEYAAPYEYVKNGRKNFYQTGISQQTDFSFSSGDENGSMFLSYQRVDSEGTIHLDKSTRQTIRFNASRKYNKFQASVNVSYSNNNMDMNNSSSGGLYNTYSIPGNYDLGALKDWHNTSGATMYDWIGSEYYYNPWAQIEIYRRTSRSDWINGSANLEYAATKWLRFVGRASVGVNVGNNSTYNHAVRYTEGAREHRYYARSSDLFSALSTSSNYNNRVNLEAMAFAEHDFNKDFGIKAMLGWSMQDNYRENKTVSAATLDIDDFFNVKNKIGELGGSNSWSQRRGFSVFGSVNLRYKNWAFLELTGRNDWTSLLAIGNNSFFYPGANASVMLTDAIPSIKKNTKISYLKLRGTFAKVGTVNIDNYNLENLSNPADYFPYGSVAAYSQSANIRYAGILPEFTTEIEFGAEIGFLKDRIVLEAAVYRQRTTNQTVNVDIPRSTGFSTLYMNAGTMVGKGLELDLRLTPLFKLGDFRWNMNLNATFSESRVEELAGGVDELAVYSPMYAIVGERYPSIKATDWVRDPDGNVVVDRNTGYPRAGDLRYLGTTEPPIRLGMSSSLRWKNWAMNFTFDYKTGHLVRFSMNSDLLFTGTAVVTEVSGRQRFVMPDSVLEVFDSSGNLIGYEKNTNVTTNSGGKNFWTSSYTQNKAVETVSAASWKLREASISYNLPNKWIDRIGFIQRVSISAVGRNLLMWTPSTNVWGDPDFSTSGNMNAPGMSGTGRGVNRTFGFSVSISF